MTVGSSDEHEPVGPAATGDDEPAVAEVGAGGGVDEYIGSRLRQAFDSVAQQPVPDRFLQLLAALDRP